MAETPLRKLRTALGMKAIDIADACDLEQSTYSKAENAPNGYRTSADVASRIVEYFGGAIALEHVLFPERFPDYGKNFPGFRSSTGVKS